MCYINTDSSINRDLAICFGIQNATNLFANTFLFQHHDQIRLENIAITRAYNEGKTITDNDFPSDPYNTAAVFENYIVDSFLVGTFFEIIAKVFILHDGKLIHKIVRNKPAPSNITKLADKQNKSPVDIKSYLLLDPFSDYKNIGRNGMKYLQTATLDYGWLYEDDYLKLLPFSVDFCEAARSYRVLRNQIHFPLIGAGEDVIELQMKPVDVYEVINDELTATIRPLFEALGKKYSFSLELRI